MVKKTLQILVGLAFVVQLAGCFYHDEHWRHSHSMYYGHPEYHDPGVNINVHA